MTNRRSFLKKSSLAGLAGLLPLNGFSMPSLAVPELQAGHSEDDFWNWVRQCYTVSRNVINLNNGGVCPQPKQVQDAHIRYYELCNEAPTFYMWRTLDQGREPLRQSLARLAGCDADEIAINRNSTEGLNTIIFGLNLKKGDEVVLTRYDYPNMMNAWKQREKRDGIKLNWIDLPYPLENDEQIVELFSKAITPKTKIVHITHLINWTGQILPARKIADMAHAKGCEVILDAAHSFAHIDYSVPELGCDYFATSLHKWLCAPFGSGMMYIKKDKIKNIWALLSNDKPDGDDIRKFESLGTRSFASEMAIGQAIDFHLTIGSKRKQERLFQLKNYWAEKVAKFDRVTLNTSLKPQFGCAIAHVEIKGMKGTEMESKLFDKFKIHTVAIEFEKLNGIRVTPNVYTAFHELDKLVEGIEYLCKA
jgi:selenocysteine lyase/cysteine desulfurase